MEMVDLFDKIVESYPHTSRVSEKSCGKAHIMSKNATEDYVND